MLPTYGVFAIRSAILATAITVGAGFLDSTAAHRIDFRSYILDEDGAVGQYCAHWGKTTICGWVVDAVYLDMSDRRAVVFSDQCDIWGSHPLDDIDVDGPISYAANQVAYMTAAGDLKYAHVPGWGIQYVDTTGVVGAENSIAADANGVPSIAYRDLTRGALKFGSRVGPAWFTEVVDSVGDTGHGASLAIDDGQVAHVSYVRHISGPGARDELVHARRGTGGWVFETAGIFAFGAVTTPTSLALRGNKACIAFGDHTTGGLRLGTRMAGSWSWFLVDSSEAGSYVSLRLDSHGYPHIAYFNAAAGDLKYAHQDSSGWTLQTVDSTGVVGAYAYLDLSWDDPSISYFDDSNDDLRIATEGGTGAVSPLTPEGSPHALAVHPSPMGHDGCAIEFRASQPSESLARVHDISGRLVRVVPLHRAGPDLWSGHWDASDSEGRSVSPGIYFISVPTREGIARAKMVTRWGR